MRQGREHCWDVVCVVLDGRECELLGCFWWGMELHEIAVEKCGNFRMERLGNAVFEGLEKSRNVIASLRWKESGLPLSQL